MALKLIPTTGTDADTKAEIAEARRMAEQADAKAANARQMVLSRDPRLMTLEGLAATVEERTEASELDRAALHDAVAALRSDLNLIELTPGPAGPQGLRGSSGVDGVQGPAGSTGAKGDAGPAGTANLAVGARPVGLLALGASTDVVVPLSRAMTGTAYNVQAAHSAVVDLSGVTLTVKTRTTTAVTITVKATGVALVAGTLVVVAI